MNREKVKRELKQKINRLDILKLNLEASVRALKDEIKDLEKELLLVVGEQQKKRQKKEVDISRYIAQVTAEFERAKQRGGYDKVRSDKGIVAEF